MVFLVEKKGLQQAFVAQFWDENMFWNCEIGFEKGILFLVQL